MSAQRYLVTARKYRPQLFHELVAQEHVTETLKNAIRLDRLAHAYLFSGPRGVGKTTAARILAKAINCTTPPEDREADAEPCRSCDSCRTFEEGRSLNIIEIDAASNNRVDDVRELRETVRIPPQGGRKKVYIVDEVHMLSTAAFNALLKTLEEPPPHVLFIFATTEPHKVLPTILSRCQRFDFRRIAVPEIVARLHDICTEEDIDIDEASLMLIARKGDGALRDALSVFDQAVSLCGSTITYPELAQALGVVDVDRYFDVTDRIAARDTAGMLRLVEHTVRAGHDLQEFLAGLAEHLRNLLVACTMEDAELIEAAEATRQRYRNEAGTFSESDLLRLLTLAADAEDHIKSATQPRLKVETVLLKMASMALGADLREAIAKIDQLAKMARGGTLPSADDAPDGGSPGPSGGGTPKRSTGEASEHPGAMKPAGSDVPEPTGGDMPEPTSSGTRPSTADEARRDDGRHPSPRGTASTVSPEGDLPEDARPAPPPAPPPAGPDSSGDGAPSVRRSGSAAPEHASAANNVFGKPALQRRPARSSHPDEPPEETRVPSDTGPLGTVWDALLDRVKENKIQVWSLLHHTMPEGYEDGVAHVAVPNDFHRRVLTSQSDYILEQLAGLAPGTVRSLHFVIREAMGDAGHEETASEFDPYEYMKRKRQENPVVRAIFEQFGGELVW